MGRVRITVANSAVGVSAVGVSAGGIARQSELARRIRSRGSFRVALVLIVGILISLAAPSAAAGFQSSPMSQSPLTFQSSQVRLPGMMTAPGDGPIVIEIDEAAYLQISFTSGSILAPPGSSQPGEVTPDLLTRTTWQTQAASEPDPTTVPTNKVTPRMLGVVQATLAAGIMPLSRIGCVSGRVQNPGSDHPNGRGCDFTFDYRTQFGVQSGWRMANWLVANQAALGIRYVIWQGLIWNAQNRPGPWTTYVSSAYGCPNPAVITGCHYDHIHVSVY